jgi:hypothetical protein
MTNPTLICIALYNAGKQPTKEQLKASREFMRQKEIISLKMLKHTIEDMKSAKK